MDKKFDKTHPEAVIAQLRRQIKGLGKQLQDVEMALNRESAEVSAGKEIQKALVRRISLLESQLELVSTEPAPVSPKTAIEKDNQKRDGDRQ